MADELEDVVLRINDTYALVNIDGKMRIIKETKDEDLHDLFQVMTVEDFRCELSNQFVWPKNRKPCPVADIWIEHAGRRQYDGVTFRPGQDFPGFFNFWRGFSVVPTPGDWSLFRDHLFKNVCGGNAARYSWLFGWFAQMVQRPNRLLGVAVALRGRKGVGKTKVGEIIGSLFPQHHVPLHHARMIAGQFRWHLISALLVQGDDIVLTGDRAALGAVNALITDPWHYIEGKGVNAIKVRNFCRLLVTGNDDWMVPATRDERRWVVFDVGAGNIRDHEFFACMDMQMNAGGRAALLHDLLAFDLNSVDLFNFPATAAMSEQKIASLAPGEKWWHDRLYQGSQLRGQDWEEYVRRDHLYDEYIAALDRVGERNKSWETELGMLLHRLYPRLSRARLWLETSGRRGGEDNKQVWCYRFGSLADARAAFETAVGVSIEWPDEQEAIDPTTSLI